MSDKNSPKYVDKNLKKLSGRDVYHSKGKIVTAVEGFFNDLTGEPPKPKAYADLDPPGDSELRLRRPGGGSDKGISVKKFSSGAKK